jgi:hypothetical protein
LLCYNIEGVEKRVLRRIFGPKREKVAGGLRRQHNGNFVTCTVHLTLLE